MTARSMVVEVLKPDYSGRIGRLPDYESCSVTWQWRGVGTGTLQTRGVSAAVLQLLAARDVRVPVTVKAPGYPRWSGWVERAEDTALVSIDSEGQTVVANGTVATLVGERRWLERILAAPDPAGAWSFQMSEYDTRTGPVATIARAFVAANIARVNATGTTLPMAVIPVAPGDASPAVTVQARNETIAEELADVLQLHGYDLITTLWLPGDPQPAGLSLTTATVVVDVVSGRSKPYVKFSDTAGGLKSRTIVVTAPKATTVIVGGPGEGLGRTFERYTDDARLAAVGPWGYGEDLLDATDADTQPLREQRARERLAELGGKVAVTVDIDDRRPWVAGPDADYWVGDQARASFTGVEVSDRIDRLTITSNAAGFTATPQFGASRETETADVRLAQSVAEMRQALAALKARR